MKEHHYSISGNWVGNIGVGTETYRAFKRDYEVLVEGKEIINGSSDPSFLGDPARYNPEELLLASVSSCHMLWYLHLCSEAGVVVTCYRDQAKAMMLESRDDGGRFTSIELFPEVILKEESMVSKAYTLHPKANELCLMPNSLNIKIQHHPSCMVENA